MARKLRLKCPICKKPVTSQDAEFPFCGERCRLIDLGKWASGAYVISSPVQDTGESVKKTPPEIRMKATEGEGGARAAPPPSREAPLWATLVATFFGIGHLRPGPGTWGSATTVLLWWLLARSIVPGWQPWAAVLLALGAILAGIPAATRVARASGRKDPQFVVIDEVAGQFITLIAAPIAWQSLLLALYFSEGSTLSSRGRCAAWNASLRDGYRGR